VEPEVDIAVSKVDDVTDEPNEGATVHFTVTVRNNGPQDATGVQIEDLLPEGLTLVDAVPSGGTYTSVDGIWDIGNLANGDEETLVFTVTINDPQRRERRGLPGE
jgi:uncharacterized repeat protein (TIGR01451 family)